MDSARLIRRASCALLMVSIGLATSAAAAYAAPDATLDVAFAPGSPNPPVPNMMFSHAVTVRNTGDVPLDGLTVIDTVPVEMHISRVTTGSYTGLADFAAGEGVRVSYEKNTALGVFALWGSSPDVAADTTLSAPPPGLGAGEYITRVRWEYGQAAPSMQPIAASVLAGQVKPTDNAGGHLEIGDSIQNCAALSGPAIVRKSECETFVLIDAPSIAVQAPDSTPLGSATQATAVLTGGWPTEAMSFSVYRASDTRCGAPVFDEFVDLDGPGTYEGPSFTAAEAGACKWVVMYPGELHHGWSDSGCTNPAGEFAVVAPPEVSADFGAEVIDADASTPLTFTITNPAANTVPLTDVALEITLPAGLVVASPNGVGETCNGGTVTAPAGSRSISLADGTIPVGSSCTFSVDVAGAEPGPATVTTDAVQSANGGTGGAATATLAVRARPAPPNEPNEPPAPADPIAPPAPADSIAPPAPRTLLELARDCSRAELVLLSAAQSGARVRFRGTASPADAGQQVTVHTLRGGAVAARATVRPDGSFEATGPLPRRSVVNKTHYFAQLGERRSPPLKLTRRLTAQLETSAATITISGRVSPPFGKPIRRVVIRQLTSCASGYAVVARARPDARGRFRVRVPRVTGVGPALYRAQTRVPTKGGGATLRTFGLVLGIDPAR
jgi:hypothetical protein